MIGLSTPASWAILALASFAQTDRRVLARDLAASLGAPLPYLSQVLHRLSVAGLVDAKRGQGGGFTLAVPAENLTVATVVDMIEGTDWLSGCLLGSAECSDARACPTHAFWKAERGRIRKALQRLTIRTVADFEIGQGRGFMFPTTVAPPRKDRRRPVRGSDHAK
ncbi:MAG: Rrf2 family transcriptional regulator [Gemmatimonadales bacterium]